MSHRAVDAGASAKSLKSRSGEHPAVRAFYASIASVRTASNRALDECDARIDEAAAESGERISAST